MADPLFGATTPVWNALHSFGYFPASVLSGIAGLGPPGLAGMAGSRSMFQAPTMTAGAVTTQGTPTLQTSPASSLGSYAPAVAPQGPFPILTGPEIGVGITAPALLTAVAIRRGQPQGPSTDQEVEDFIYDALDLLPGASDIEVRCDAGIVTLTGTVTHKRLKRDAGEIAWAIPNVHDVQNNVTVSARRRQRGPRRENEPPTPGPATRKQT